MKRLLLALVLALIGTMTACSGSVQDYVRIDVYAADGTLLKSIEKTTELTTIGKDIHMGESNIYIGSIPNNAIPEYHFVFFTKLNGNEATENFTFTIYGNSNLIHTDYPFDDTDVIYTSEKAIKRLRNLV